MSSRRALLHEQMNRTWRRCEDVLSSCREASGLDKGFLSYRVSGDWWDALASTRSVLLVAREYEHLLLALRSDACGEEISYLSLPHPSGIAVDEVTRSVYLACTRNPNQIVQLQPVVLQNESGTRTCVSREREEILLPLHNTFYPGSLYLHDLAWIQGKLYGAAAGHNAIVELKKDGTFLHRWWPPSIETEAGPRFDRNYLQCNSIAPGRSLRDSYFSTSAEYPGHRRPGHRNFPVDGRGVIFSGKDRRIIARGLTRPHSARQWQGKVWIDNSGYGEIGFAEEGRFRCVGRLPGWTRGLCFRGDVAFVGVSRILPRFFRYAPGLDPRRSCCGVFAMDIRNGDILGGITWPLGNQIFSVELLPEGWPVRLPLLKGQRNGESQLRDLCSSFSLGQKEIGKIGAE